MRKLIGSMWEKSLFLLILLMMLSMTAYGASCVDDQAGLLNQTQINKLTEQINKMEKEFGYQYMIVTTDDAEGKSAVEVAEDYFMDHKDGDDGVAYLIDMDNREIYIASSGIFRYILDNDRVEENLDEAYYYVTNGKYADAFAAMLTNTSVYIKEGVRNGTYLRDQDTGKITMYQAPKTITPLEALIAVIAGLGVCGLIMGVTVGRYRMKIGHYKYSYRDNHDLRLDENEDVFVNKIVTHRHIPKNNSGSSGGSGGGGHASTVHTGSGGHSFGGGGRKF